ncbi:hypothetical protein GCM10014715_17800 [Streptomyces spiralis]|uniref:Uncharacterized protein n=1 Tax=Streptomyces spiralis TaxID=66376 RepID=A0A918ZQ10_9ACTN|nr:hypothetical protein [Streptomyces spiralis]GHE64747.1 hypothetical protein GCM10014715_17800 [Streptomyces spiralis]
MKPVRASWGRCLAYGLISGTAAFVVLMLAVGLLPVDDGGVALLMYAALVVPPALVARRFGSKPTARPRNGRALRSASAHARKPEPRTERVSRPKPGPRSKPGAPPAPERGADAVHAAEQAVTEYGELLTGHPYTPRPANDPDDLADYATALQAYEDAKASTPDRVPEILERGRAALERLDVAARAVGHGLTWIHGSGTTRVRVHRPGTGGRVLLVFEAEGREHGAYSVSGTGFGRATELVKGACGPDVTRARVLVPPQRGAVMLLEVSAPGPWRLALRPAGEARQLRRGTRLTGRGVESVVKAAGLRAVRFEHHGDGPYRLLTVTRSLHTGPVLADGRGEARLTVPVPDRCLLRIETTGRWSLYDSGT